MIEYGIFEQSNQFTELSDTESSADNQPDSDITDVNILDLRNRLSGKYKDTIFKDLFSRKTNAIQLCNAVTGSQYGNYAKVDVYESKPLDTVSNDMAVTIEGELLLLSEHQSTWNPNMPFRLLIYLSAVYSNYMSKEIYADRLVDLPTPKFYVFFNGPDKTVPEILRLSDAFVLKEKRLFFDLIVQVINIRESAPLLKYGKEHPLYGYSYLIEQINKNKNAGMKQDEAVAKAVYTCIEQGILEQYLKDNLEGVVAMYNLERLSEMKEQGLILAGERRGEVKGKIETLLEFNFSPKQIAEKIKISADEVERIIKEKIKE
jgi:hypothetical protein